MRGKELLTERYAIVDGITPAYAGKSLAVVLFGVSVQDHPRICGEKEGQPGRHSAVMGSPPHMRGKVSEPALFGTLSGITPAYAGKSARTHAFYYFI